MTITSGVGGRFLLGEYNLSGTVGMLTRLSMETGQQNTTSIQDEAMARTATLRQGAIDWRGYFDDAAGSSHEALSTVPLADRAVSYLHRATRGAPAWVQLAKQVSYIGEVQNGELHFDVQTVANGTGLELGHTLTAGVENSTGTETLGGVDDSPAAATTNFGFQAFLHVVSFTGTSVDVQIQDSDDDGGGDAYTDVAGGGFTTVTGVGAERIASGRTQALKRWARVDISGTYTNLDLVVVLVRNEQLTSF